MKTFGLLSLSSAHPDIESRLLNLEAMVPPTLVPSAKKQALKYLPNIGNFLNFSVWRL